MDTLGMLMPYDEGFTPAAEGHGPWPWMNALAFGRDVPHWGVNQGATGFARGAPRDTL
jgi:hypothetical protein